MVVLRVILTIVYILICVALAVIVLMQEGKNRGLGSLAGSSETYWGQNNRTSMEGGLVKITKILAAAFFVLSLILSMGFLK